MWPFRRPAAFNIRSSQAYWLLRDGIGDSVGRAASLSCDIAIVGAGISAALVADALIATGRRIVVLDRHEPVQGSTAASTALLQYEIDTDLVELTRLRGAGLAARAYRACVKSFATLEQRFPDLLAQGEYQRRESVYLASDERAVPKLQAELAARRAIGIRAEWLEGPELQRRYGCQRPAAIVSSPAATMDPVRFARGVWAGCRRHGVEIYGRSRVEGIDEFDDGLQLRLSGGPVVRAQHVVVAAGYDSLPFMPEGLADIDNTFALVTEPLADDRQAAALPPLWETSRPYLYIRSTQDGRLIVGGADVPFKTATAREILLPRQVRRLAAGYEQLFGRELPPIAWAWGGSFAKTVDGLPFIGRVRGRSPRLYFAACFGGNGITFAAHAGDMIRAGIEGRDHELDEVFGFGRLGTAPARDLVKGVTAS